MTVRLEGLFPSVSLPLRDDLAIAERDYVVQVQHLARAGTGVGGVVVNDPSSGGGGLSREEQASVLELSRVAAPAGFPVIACIAATSVETASGLLQDARDQGADAVLVLPLSDPDEHARFAGSAQSACAALEQLAGVAGLPVLVGQGRPGLDAAYTTDVLLALSRLPAVAGIVSAVGDVALYAEQYQALDRAVPVLVSVEGPQLLDLLRAGAEGAVLGVSNIVPRAWARFIADVRSGRTEAAEAWYQEAGLGLVTGLADAQDRDAAIAAAWVKHGLVLLGQNANGLVRPPQSALDERAVASVQTALVGAGLLAS